MINPAWSLDQINVETPLWGALIAADGRSVIPLLLNPIAIKRGQSANTSVLPLYLGGTRVIWTGNGPEDYTLDMLVTGGIQQDITPVLEALAGAIGRSWRYVHGQRVTPAALVTNVTIDEDRWLNGKPTRAKVSIQMSALGAIPTVEVTYGDLTDAEISDLIRQATAQGYRSVTLSGLTVYSESAPIGSVLNGLFFPY